MNRRFYIADRGEVSEDEYTNWRMNGVRPLYGYYTNNEAPAAKTHPLLALKEENEKLRAEVERLRKLLEERE